MRFFSKKGSLRNIQGERYGRLVIPGATSKLIRGKHGNWKWLYKKTIKKWR